MNFNKESLTIASLFDNNTNKYVFHNVSSTINSNVP